MNLARYYHLYRSSSSAKRIASHYLGVPITWMLPLSISHGVDFDHETLPQDATNCEPLHWCYNDNIWVRLRGEKPGVRIPHPWLMLEATREGASTQREGSLLVGPPTSVTNDVALAAALDREGLRPNAILLKNRTSSETDRSRAFWNGRGVATVSARTGEEHLQDLLTILGGYAEVLLPVFSSVGVFAAASGCRVRLVRGYSHCSYSPRRVDLDALVRSPTARALVRVFGSDDSVASRDFCRGLLGASLSRSRAQLVADLDAKLNRLETPLHIPAAKNRMHRRALAEASRVLGRTDFLKHGFVRAARFKALGNRSEIVWKKVNMLDAIENGLSSANCSIRGLRPDEEGVQSGRGADE